MKEEDLLLGLFVLLISTAGILIIVIALITIFGYISLFVFILFIFAFFIFYVIKKSNAYFVDAVLQLLLIQLQFEPLKSFTHLSWMS